MPWLYGQIEVQGIIKMLLSICISVMSMMDHQKIAHGRTESYLKLKGVMMSKIKVNIINNKILVLVIAGVFALGGCATSYRKQMTETLKSTQTGSIEVGLAELEKNNAGLDKSLLYYLEKGELLRMQGSLPESRDSFLVADGTVRQWEEAVKTDPSKIMGEIGSFLINDTTRRYEGRDYEKVLLSTRLALNHMAIGDWDAARVEIKKMHEREAVIADFRSKEIEEAKNGAAEQGLKVTSFKELNGYPVETLTSPEVLALKNAYESSFANYLAGFIYEAQNEGSLAAAGYRKAIEIGGENKALVDGLKNLDARIGKMGANGAGVDTLIVIESGAAPVIKSVSLPIPLPIPSGDGLRIVLTPLSWPVIEGGSSEHTQHILIGDKKFNPTLITNVDHMARRALSDEMPGIIFRSSVRAIAKGAAQKVVQDNAASLGPFGALISIATSITAVVSEQADERIWGSLPGRFSIVRVSLPAGAHRVTLDTPTGPVTKDVQVSGSHALVTLRSTGNAVYLTQSPYDSSKVAMHQMVPDSVAAEAEPKPKTSAKKKSVKPKVLAVKDGDAEMKK